MIDQASCLYRQCSASKVVALRAAARALSNYRLPASTLYVTLEPCLLCVGAIVQARVSTVVFGARDPKGGAVRSLLRVDDLPLNHRFEIVEGVLAGECAELLQDFFKARRGGRSMKIATCLSQSRDYDKVCTRVSEASDRR